MDIASNKDFTIEERLHEESFVSKDNYRDDSKTIELGTSNDIYRTTAPRMTQPTIMPGHSNTLTNQDNASAKIRIENNLVLASS